MTKRLRAAFLVVIAVGAIGMTDIPAMASTAPDPSVALSVDQTQPAINANVTYTITVTGDPDKRLIQGLSVNVQLGASTYVSDDGQKTYDPRSAFWTVPDIGGPNPNVAKLHITAKMPSTPTSFQSLISLQPGPDGDRNQANNLAGVTITVVSTAGAKPGSFDPGTYVKCLVVPSVCGNEFGGNPVDGVMTTMLRWMLQQVAAGVNGLLDQAWLGISAGLQPDAGNASFRLFYGRIEAWAFMLLAACSLIGLGIAAIRRDGAAAIQTGIFYPALGAILVPWMPSLIQVLLNLAQEFGKSVVGTVDYAGSLGTLLKLSTNLPDISGGWSLLTLLFMAFALLAGLLAMLEITVRAMGIYILMLGLPMVVALIPWTRRLFKIWMELLIALIMAQPVMYIIVAFSAALFASWSPNVQNGVDFLALGIPIVTWWLVVFSPLSLMGLVPMAERAAGSASHMRTQVFSHAQQIAGQMQNSGQGTVRELISRFEGGKGGESALGGPLAFTEGGAGADAAAVAAGGPAAPIVAGAVIAAEAATQAAQSAMEAGTQAGLGGANGSGPGSNGEIGTV